MLKAIFCVLLGAGLYFAHDRGWLTKLKDKITGLLPR